MKAAVFKALHTPLEIEDVADPKPGPNEVMVRVRRCGICGSDLHATVDPAYHASRGDVLGHEYAGEVVDLGKGVEGIRKGDLVAVMPTHGCGHCGPCLMGEPSWCEKFKLDGGGYAQYSVAEPHQCIRLPKTVSMDDGALVEPLAVSLRAANLANIKAGSRVLVIGAGPIGLGVIFWAHHLGAGKIVVTNLDRLPEPLARTMGADEFITVSQTQSEDINRALGGAPDIVFECVGAPGLIVQSIEQVRPRGTVVLVGLCTVPEPINPFELIQKSAVIQPSAFYGVKEFEVAIDTLDAGHVEPHAMITETVGLDAMPPAFEGLRHRTSQCKILVDPWAN